MMIGIYAGRFQPFHNGHFGAVEYILSEVDLLYVIVCSRRGKTPLDDKNPFTFEERKDMILRSTLRLYPKRIRVRHVCDADSDEEWTKVVTRDLTGDMMAYSNNDFTIKAFQKYGFNTKSIPIKHFGLNATLIRKLIIRREMWENLVPHGTEKTIKEIWEY